MSALPRLRPLLLAATGALALAAGPVRAQSASPDAPPPAFPAAATQPPSAPAADMQSVLDALQRLGGKPIETLTPAQARRQPTPADAAKAVLKAQGRAGNDDADVITKDLNYASDPWQKARIYTPPGGDHGPKLPVIVYFHGGGFVIADLDVYDATPRLLAKQMHAIVVSVEYRHAPEHRFPAQVADAIYAYDWVLKNVGSWNGDRGKLAVVGESAGGALAVNVAVHARDAGKTKPTAVIAVYPIASGDPSLASKRDYANAKPLNGAMLSWFAYYAGQGPDATSDPKWDLTKADLHGLAPVTIVNAEIDPLRDDGAALEQALKAAGVPVERRVFPGVTHEFFGMGKVVRGAYDAEVFVETRLKPAFNIILPGERGSFEKAPKP